MKATRLFFLGIWVPRASAKLSQLGEKRNCEIINQTAVNLNK